MNKFKLTKEHEGKDVWCVPTQNNVNLYGENARNAIAQATLKTITDVKRITVMIDGNKHWFADYKKGLTHAQYNTKHNSGWLVFESEFDFIMWKNLQKDINLIKQTLQQSYGKLPLDDSQIERIATIIREGE